MSSVWPFWKVWPTLETLLLFRTATGTNRDRPEVPNGRLQHPEDKPGEPGEAIHVSGHTAGTGPGQGPGWGRSGPFRSLGEPGSLCPHLRERRAGQADTGHACLSRRCVQGEERRDPGAHHRRKASSREGACARRGIRCWPSPAFPSSPTLPGFPRIPRLCPKIFLYRGPSPPRQWGTRLSEPGPL